MLLPPLPPVPPVPPPVPPPVDFGAGVAELPEPLLLVPFLFVEVSLDEPFLFVVVSLDEPPVLEPLPVLDPLFGVDVEEPVLEPLFCVALDEPEPELVLFVDDGDIPG